VALKVRNAELERRLKDIGEQGLAQHGKGSFI